jgi:hypothetical protein
MGDGYRVVVKKRVVLVYHRSQSHHQGPHGLHLLAHTSRTTRESKMTNEQIKRLALANGFKLKEQPDGRMDLNPYVYEFARSLIGPSIVKPACWATSTALARLANRADNAPCVLTGHQAEFNDVPLYTHPR